MAIGQIFNNINNMWSYIAYAAGFATGTFVGMYIEEKLALGRVVVRLITREPVHSLITFLHDYDYRYSIIDAEGRTGRVNVVFTVVKREKLKHLISGINQHHPKAFFTIEGVKKVSEEIPMKETASEGIGFRWFQLKRR